MSENSIVVISAICGDGSVVPPGLVGLGLLPLAGARGFILAPLRGEERESLRARRLCQVRVLAFSERTRLRILPVGERGSSSTM
jgi:hypothetical protein